MVWLKRDSPLRLTLSPLPEELEQPGDAATPVRPGAVLQQIRNLIADGQFPPGSRLLAERALAAQLGVGRPALREAIKALNVLEELESRRGAGTFVKIREPGASGRPAMAEGGAFQFGLLDLLEVRNIIEPRAAWLAAARASERHLLEIQAAGLRLSACSGRDWREVARLDRELHSAIIRASENPALVRIDRFLCSQISRRQAEVTGSMPDLGRMRRDHDAILECISKKQPDAAEKAMSDHVQAASMDLFSQVRR